MYYQHLFLFCRPGSSRRFPESHQSAAAQVTHATSSGEGLPEACRFEQQSRIQIHDDRRDRGRNQDGVPQSGVDAADAAGRQGKPIEFGFVQPKTNQFGVLLQIEEQEHKTIAVDAALQGYDPDQAKFVFTDITFGIKDNERTVVVRQPDGTLENATPEIRKRVNQIYFPKDGRRLRQPKLFEPEYLKACLDQHNYEFILDRSCVQFEPFEHQFHAITQKVYHHINETKQFDLLRSTRHFGPMTFFFAWHKLVDNLLIDIIQRDFMHNAVELISLTYRLNGITFDESILHQLDQLKQRKAESLERHILAIGHGELQQDIEAKVGQTAEDFEINDVCFSFIEAFNKSHAIKKSSISAALQTYREKNDERRRLFEGLQKAHGVS